MDDFLPFAVPEIGNEEIREVVDSLESGWLTTGPKTKKFEMRFQEFLGSDFEAVAVNSATAGLHLALEALGVGPGDEVITTVHTFTATAEVVRYLGAHPVFVDIDPKTLNLNIEQVEKKITDRTKVIMPVHFAGLACNMTLLLKIAKKHRLKIVEDAAHALPATHNKQIVGTFDSDATVFSFYANKTITTGEGGMLVTRHPELAHRARIMRLHGISRDAFDRFTSKQPSWRYEIVAPGFKYNMTDIAASIGIHQLVKVWKFQEKRTALANKYNEAFANLPIELPPNSLCDDIHSWHIYVIRLKDECLLTRDKFIQEMYERKIGCSVHYIPLHYHPYWRNLYNLTPDDFPESSSTFRSSITLPLYSKMSNQQQERIINSVTEILST